jgi:hypothetical protein
MSWLIFFGDCSEAQLGHGASLLEVHLREAPLLPKKHGLSGLLLVQRTLFL